MKTREKTYAAGGRADGGELELARSELSAFFNNSSESLFLLAVEGARAYRFLRVNRAFLSTTGLRREQVEGKLAGEVIPRPSLRKVLANYREAIRRGTRVQWEETSVYPKGVKRGEVSVQPIFGASGRCTHLAGSVHDITAHRGVEAELQRTNKALMVVSECNHALVRARTVQELLDEVCRIIVETGGYRMAWVGIAEHDREKSVRPVSHCGLENGYLKNAGITWADEPRGRGPTGTAIRTGRPSVMADILHDPRFRPWRAEARKRGYASSVCIPVTQDGKAAGALSVYSERKNAFDREELGILAGLGMDVGYGMKVLRDRAALRESEARFREIAASSRTWVWETDAKGLYTYASPIATQLLGYQPGEIVGRKHFYDFFAPEEREKLKKGALRVFASKKPFDKFLNKVVRKDGKTVWVSTSAMPVLDAKGRLLGYRGADTDVTEKQKAEEIMAGYAGMLEVQIARKSKELRERLAELEKKNRQLENFKEYAITREKKIIELKRLVARLEGRRGQTI